MVHRTCNVYKAVVTGESGKLVEFTAPVADSSPADKNGMVRPTGIDREASQGGILSNHTDNTAEHGPNHAGGGRRWLVTQHRTVTLTEILDHAHAPSTVDFLSLDIEGAEYDALSTFAFDRYTFSVMTIERPSGQLQHLLREKGYEYIKDHGAFGDQMWAHSSKAALARSRLSLTARRRSSTSAHAPKSI